MKIKVYNYVDEVLELNFPKKTIKSISRIDVIIRAGDETGCITFKNGEIYKFDAVDAMKYGGRCIDCNDGGYTLTDPEAIKAWVNFIPTGKSFEISYERQEIFTNFVPKKKDGKMKYGDITIRQLKETCDKYQNLNSCIRCPFYLSSVCFVAKKLTNNSLEKEFNMESK